MEIQAKTDKERKHQLKLVYDFIKSHKLAVMATVTGNSLPEAAVVGIGVEENLELICSTFSTSRKYENIKHNPKVALVIGWEHGKTVQYEGTAEEMSIEQSEENPLRNELEKIPTIAKYVQREYGVFYKIKPEWIRMSDLSVDPWERFEIKF